MAQRSTLKLDVGQLDARMQEGAVKGLNVALEHLLKMSRDEVPHEEGTLERSGTTSVDAADLKGAVSYDMPYAVIQHEDLTFRHDEGRSAKYLELPMHEERDTMLDLIANALRDAID